MSLVGIAMTVPTITFLLIGGVASDRFERRWLLVGADLLRAVALALLAGLTIGGQIELWHVVVLAAMYGTGAAFHAPAFDALVPEILSGERLTQANALDQLMRPLALRLAGPALGGVLVGVAGAGGVFVLDCATFLMAAGTRAADVAGARRRARWPSGGLDARRPARRVALRARPRLAVGDLRQRRDRLPAVHGPGRGAAAVGGQGGDEAARPSTSASSSPPAGWPRCCARSLLGRFGLPRRGITFMLLAWTLATLGVAGYGVASAIWQLMIASAIFNALETAGTIVWATTKQRHVPSALLGRVSSLDWLISVGLLPLSFALTGPVSARDRRPRDADRAPACSARS